MLYLILHGQRTAVADRARAAEVVRLMGLSLDGDTIRRNGVIVGRVVAAGAESGVYPRLRLVPAA